MEENKPKDSRACVLVAALNELGYNIITLEARAVKIFSEDTQTMITRGVIHLDILPRVREGEFPEME
jgi:N-dimethylarginine dimethylaminohydrolase